MANFVRAAAIDEIKPGAGKQIEVAGKTIALFNIGGGYHAIDGICTHQGGPLGDGTVNGEEVTCPWHGAVFNVTSGAVQAGPAQQNVISYPVRVVGNDVEIEL